MNKDADHSHCQKYKLHCNSWFTIHSSISGHHMGAEDGGAAFGGGRGLIPFFFMNSVT